MSAAVQTSAPLRSMADTAVQHQVELCAQTCRAAVHEAWHDGWAVGEQQGYMKGMRAGHLNFACLGFILGGLFVAFFTWLGTVA